MRVPATIAILGIAANVLGCSVLDPEVDRRDEYEAALRRWSSQGIHRYEYRFQRTGCECLPEWTRPYLIEVDDGEIVESRDAETGTPAPASFHPLTVFELFALIDEAIDMDAFVLNVQYDRDDGYPRMIVVDYDRQVADDEFTIRASDLLSLR